MRNIIIAAVAAAILGSAGAALAQQPAPAPSGGGAGGAMPSAADLIKRWDTDKDGAVSKAEWTAAGRPAERFDMIDANKDGKISGEELEKAMAAMRVRQGGGQ